MVVNAGLDALDLLAAHSSHRVGFCTTTSRRQRFAELLRDAADGGVEVDAQEARVFQPAPVVSLMRTIRLLITSVT
jgi:hypothetical protein